MESQESIAPLDGLRLSLRLNVQTLVLLKCILASAHASVKH